MCFATYCILSYLYKLPINIGLQNLLHLHKLFLITRQYVLVDNVNFNFSTSVTILKDKFWFRIRTIDVAFLVKLLTITRFGSDGVMFRTLVQIPLSSGLGKIFSKTLIKQYVITLRPTILLNDRWRFESIYM